MKIGLTPLSPRSSIVGPSIMHVGKLISQQTVPCFSTAQRRRWLAMHDVSIREETSIHSKDQPEATAPPEAAAGPRSKCDSRRNNWAVETKNAFHASTFASEQFYFTWYGRRTCWNLGAWCRWGNEGDWALLKTFILPVCEKEADVLLILLVLVHEVVSMIVLPLINQIKVKFK